MATILPSTTAGVIEGAVAAQGGGCYYCGERHSDRVTCGEVQGRLDGVTVHNPEGRGGLSCWAGGRRPALAADWETDEEWVLGGL